MGPLFTFNLALDFIRYQACERCLPNDLSTVDVKAFDGIAEALFRFVGLDVEVRQPLHPAISIAKSDTDNRFFHTPLVCNCGKTNA